MKNPWIFGVLILIILGYFAWNSFELPLIGKTEKIKGKIFEIKYHPGVRGMGFVQGVSFIYARNNKYYEGNYVLNFRDQSQNIGNSISLSVLVSNPEKVKVLGFYKQSNHRNIRNKYYPNNKKCYSELVIENKIYREKTFLTNEGIEKVIIGKVNHIGKNLITLTPFKLLKYKEKNIVESKLFEKIEKYTIKIEQKDKEIISVNCDERVYRKLN